MAEKENNFELGEYLNLSSQQIDEYCTLLYETEPLFTKLNAKGDVFGADGNPTAIFKEAIKRLSEEKIIEIANIKPLVFGTPREPLGLVLSDNILGLGGKPLSQYLLRFSFFDTFGVSETEKAEFYNKFPNSKYFLAIDPKSLLVFVVYALASEQSSFDFENGGTTQDYTFVAFPSVALVGDSQCLYYNPQTEKIGENETPSEVVHLTLLQLFSFIGEYCGESITLETRDFLRENFPFSENYNIHDFSTKEKREYNTLPTRFEILNDVVTNTYESRANIELGKELPVPFLRKGHFDVKGKRAKENVIVKATLYSTNENGEQVESEQTITEQISSSEQALVSAVNQAYKEAEIINDLGERSPVSLELLNKYYSRNPQAVLTDEREQELIRMLKKLNGLGIKLDLMALVKNEYVTHDSLSIQGKYINVNIITRTVNGKEKNYVEILGPPKLGQFASQTGNIISYDTNRGVNSNPLTYNGTSENIGIETYLIKQVYRLNKEKRNNKILFTTISQNCKLDYPNQSKQMKAKTRAKIYKILEALLKDTDFTFEETRKGKKIDGVMIVKKPTKES